MARAKKKVKEVVVVEVKTVGDGDIDPYASGVSIPNPEPNNGNVLGQTTISTVQEASTFVVPSAPEGEQDEIAEGREEKVTVSDK